MDFFNLFNKIKAFHPSKRFSLEVKNGSHLVCSDDAVDYGVFEILNTNIFCGGTHLMSQSPNFIEK